MIVLRHERKWYVLEEPLGEAPPANAPAAARNAHKKHSDDLLDVACLMLATMSPDLQAGLINTNAYDMIRQLRCWDFVRSLYQTDTRKTVISNLTGRDTRQNHMKQNVPKV
ncbi:hypothetical protein OSB04_028747 [Centaurea solstitialis]|uniref:Uncharacterized protein n=1 Tax=Centaurea solstitialis TaxID=347529 RepID=A0AA38WBH6_9ASTR|nr:hypothetical protein OSB04_028747 [Centaurea solstitialis]